MLERLTRQLREYVVILSIILIIVGIIVLLMGVIWYWFKDLQLGIYTDTIYTLQDWNAYLLVLGVIIFAFGLYYLYNYHKLKKFLIEELATNKRSEILKKHSKLKETVKHLPFKYKKMLADKEQELHIK